jgi:hypothetical protein
MSNLLLVHLNPFRVTRNIACLGESWTLVAASVTPLAKTNAVPITASKTPPIHLIYPLLMSCPGKNSRGWSFTPSVAETQPTLVDGFRPRNVGQKSVIVRIAAGEEGGAAGAAQRLCYVEVLENHPFGADAPEDREHVLEHPFRHVIYHDEEEVWFARLAGHT